MFNVFLTSTRWTICTLQNKLYWLIVPCLFSFSCTLFPRTAIYTAECFHRFCFSCGVQIWKFFLSKRAQLCYVGPTIVLLLTRTNQSFQSDFHVFLNMARYFSKIYNRFSWPFHYLLYWWSCCSFLVAKSNVVQLTYQTPVVSCWQFFKTCFCKHSTSVPRSPPVQQCSRHEWFLVSHLQIQRITTVCRSSDC